MFSFFFLAIPQQFHASQYLSIYSFNLFRTIVAFLKARYPAPKFVGPGGAAIPFPEGSNVELFNHCFANMDTFEDKHMDYEKDYCESLDASRVLNLLDALYLNPQNTHAISLMTIKANADIPQWFTS